MSSRKPANKQMRNKGNVKTKTLEFTHVKKVHTRKIEVVHLNMQLLLLLFGFFAEYCLNVCDSPALSLSLPVCVCVCVCVAITALRWPSAVRSQKYYQGNSSELGRGNRHLYLRFSIETHQIRDVCQVCCVCAKDPLSTVF